MTHYYWCLEHGRVEAESDRCRADNRLGPYATAAAASAWRETVEARNDAWDEDDEEWDEDDWGEDWGDDDE